MIANLEAFVFGRTDWEYASNNFVFPAKIGWRFVHTDHGECNGQFTGCGADACETAVQVDAIQPMGLLITGGQFVAFTGHDPVEVRVNETCKGNVRFVNCAFWGPALHNAVLKGRGFMSFADCYFSSDRKDADAALVVAEAGRVQISNSSFATTQTSVVLGPDVRHAIIQGNNGRDGVRIIDQTDGKVISMNNEPSGPPTATAPAQPGQSMRPTHTFSIVARDKATGQLGVAVQSHWFSVGSSVPWAESGVGAVATQSFGDPAYGALGLELMRRGKSAPEALRGLLAADERSAVRQVAMIDGQGRVAAFTGDKCIASAGHIVDEEGQFSVQANLMDNNTIWPAMATAYRQAQGDLADRLIAALEAAQHAGGDLRGQQSAAIVVVEPNSSGKPWSDRIVDLRIEDHPDPIGELKRLLAIQRAYNHMNAGDAAIEKKDFDTANREYTAAAKLAPQIVELPFWQAVALASNGQAEQALPIFKDVFAKERRWMPLVPRLMKVGLLPDDPKLLEQINAQAPR